MWCGILLAAALVAPVARSDGGRVCASERSGTLRVSLLTAPTPLRVGRAEIVLVVEAAPEATTRTRLRLWTGERTRLDLDERSGPGGGVFPAEVDLDLAGPIEIEAHTEQAADAVTVRCHTVAEQRRPALLANWPLLALPPLAVALFATGRLAGRPRSARRRQPAA